MNNTITPPSIAAPVGMYSHAVEVPAGARSLHIAGQVGMRPDGTVPTEFEDQVHQAWRNVIAILEAADMAVADLVHVNHWLVDQKDFETYAKIRAEYLGDARPAATLMIVKALVKSEFMVEVGGVAARVD